MQYPCFISEMGGKGVPPRHIAGASHGRETGPAVARQSSDGEANCKISQHHYLLRILGLTKTPPRRKETEAADFRFSILIFGEQIKDFNRPPSRSV